MVTKLGKCGVMPSHAGIVLFAIPPNLAVNTDAAQ
jgi:hypothetical protein